MKFLINSGPTLMDLRRSLDRHVDHKVFEVEFEYEDRADGDTLALFVLIQGMDRPKEGRKFWRLKASCKETSDHDFERLKFVMIYNPETRKGYLDWAKNDECEALST